jgi:hypothetical protein
VKRRPAVTRTPAAPVQRAENREPAMATSDDDWQTF